jgi:hypothetical protein
MKRLTLPVSADKNMTVRNKSFFRKFTGVQRAVGFNVNSMHSVMGFSNSNATNEKPALEGMEKNEIGGVTTEGMMYGAKTRTSNSAGRLVRKAMRYDKGKIVVSKGRNKGSNVAAIYSALKQKKFAKIKTAKGSFIVKPTSASKYKRGNSAKGYSKGQNRFKLQFLMHERRRRPAKAKATHFVEEAGEATHLKVEKFYYQNAKYQFEKTLRY